MRFKIDWASFIVRSKFTFLLCFTLYLRAIFRVHPPGGRGEGLYLEGQFNGGFFCVTGFGGLYMEGLIFGISRYLFYSASDRLFRALSEYLTLPGLLNFPIRYFALADCQN